MKKLRFLYILSAVVWWIFALVVGIFLLAAVLLYVPAVQDFAVRETTAALSRSTGMRVSVKQVRLAFPLDLAVHGVVAVGADGDTLLDARALRLGVEVMPLFRAQANVDGIELYDARIDTQDFVGGTHVRGTVGALTAALHGVGWETQRVRVNRASLKDADLLVCLSDTVLDDTTTVKAHWCIDVERAELENVRAKVALAAAVPEAEADTVCPEQMWVAADVGTARLDNGHFDTGRNRYAFGRFDLQRSRLAYRAKGSDGRWTRRVAMPPIPADRRPSRIDTLRSRWDYADNLSGLAAWDAFGAPQDRALDPDNIVLSDVSLSLNELSYNERGQLRLSVAGASLRERSGLAVRRLSGEVYLDNDRLRLPALQLQTPASTLTLSGDVPWAALSRPSAALTLRLDATLGWQDVTLLARGYVEPEWLRLYPHLPLRVKGSLRGNLSNARFDDLLVQMTGVVRLTVRGSLSGLDRTPHGNVHFAAETGSRLPSLYARLLPDVATSIALPARLTARGDVRFAADAYDFDVRLGAGGGTAQAHGRANLASEAFRGTLQASRFPLHAFLPALQATPFSGTVQAEGNTFDVLSARARMQAKARVEQLVLNGFDLSGIRLDATLAGGKAHADFEAQNPLLAGSGTLEADLAARDYNAVLDAQLSRMDLLGLGLTADTLQTGGHFRVNATASKDFKSVEADGSLYDVYVMTAVQGFNPPDLDFAFAMTPDSTWARALSGDLNLAFGTRGDLNRLLPRLSRLSSLAMEQFERRELDQEALKRELPPMDLHLAAGPRNPASNFLRMKGCAFRSAYIDLHAHPENGLSGEARMGAFSTGAILLDTVHLAVSQDTTGVQLDGFVKNYTKKNPTKFDARMHAYLLAKGAGVETQFYDSDGEKGVDLGLRADIVPGGLNIVLYPENPVLAYRSFTINKDNYVFLGKNRQVRANIDLLADDGTGLQLYSNATDSVNDITLSVNDVNLGELSNVMPYLPRLEGMLSGDVHVYDNHRTFSAMSSLQATGFAYEGTPLGNVGTDLVYLPMGGGEHQASAYVSVDGKDVLEAGGAYAEADGGSFDGNVALTGFPLPLLNAFLDGSDLMLAGRANGKMNVSGNLSSPRLDGRLEFDSAYVSSDVYGLNFALDEKPVSFDRSRLVFDRFNLRSTGTNPLVLDGSVDLSDLNRVRLDLLLKGDDFELINARKRRNSMVFGKLFADVQATVKGTTDNLTVRGMLDIQDKTDMTYILKDSPLTVDNRLDDLVKFVSFTDTVADDEAELPAPAAKFDLSLGIDISDAAAFHCLLSEDGQNYADIEGGGNLTLRITQQGDMRLTGKLTAHSGELKYALPVIPLRTFTLADGSTIEFTGDPANPTLNVQATERMKVLVTEDGAQRAVAFDVGVAITKPLEQMGLEFTIAAPEDLSIQNQLAAMSKEQRAKAAVAMMATGMYLTDDGAQTSGFKANNALNAFLQNEIQSIAGNALKTVDLSVGVETGTSTVGTQTTDYSFQFAKRLWDDRIRVVVGGRVSAGKNADNSAESIINNVSVEYRMNQGATRYVRLFYDRDQQDPLEGQLTRTGLGYSVRRKATKFGDLFIFWKK